MSQLAALFLSVLFQSAPPGFAEAKDYIALVNSGSDVLVRWGMEPSDPHSNTAVVSGVSEYPGLKLWNSNTRDPEPRVDGYSEGSGAVLTGCAFPEDRMAAALQTTSEIRFFSQTTIEILFSMQKLPGNSDSTVYFSAVKSRAENDISIRFSPLVFQRETGEFSSVIGSGPIQKAKIPWHISSEAGHWYYAVIRLQFADTKIEYSVNVADLTAGDKNTREAVPLTTRPLDATLFTDKGIRMQIGIGSGIEEKRAAPVLFDEIVISKGLLTSEQINERLAALLKR